MSRYSIEGSTLTAISDAIREKDGTTDKIQVKEFADRISAIEGGGGGGYEPPEVVISGLGNNVFMNGRWDWFIKDFPDKITTQAISDATNLFSGSTLESIPFEINLADTITGVTSVFANMRNLKEVPVVKCLNHKLQNGAYSYGVNLTYFFDGCWNLRYIPEDYFTEMFGEEYWESAKAYTSNRTNIISNCYSLRNFPSFKCFVNKQTSSYSALYYNMLNRCYVLDKALNIPVMDSVALTSNFFNNAFSELHRAKDIIFETNEDGSPIVAQWKAQYIQLSYNVGFAPSNKTNYITGYNSGITEATRITDDASYQELKENVDSWTTDIAYSRYNRESAVKTINSLPDTSAYLATAGGTNTIAFKGASGSATDGGAINTLTEAEIAVATAKGWTVTLS